MLQLFHMVIAKVDLNVTYVGIVIHVRFKCFICFRRMLQIFYMYVSKVDQVLHMLQWTLVVGGQWPVAATWCCYWST
jgi:hypothetical protein